MIVPFLLRNRTIEIISRFLLCNDRNEDRDQECRTLICFTTQSKLKFYSSILEGSTKRHRDMNIVTHPYFLNDKCSPS